MHQIGRREMCYGRSCVVVAALASWKLIQQPKGEAMHCACDGSCVSSGYCVDISIELIVTAVDKAACLLLRLEARAAHGKHSGRDAIADE